MKKIIVIFLVLLTICSLSLTMVPAAFSQSPPTNVKILSYSWYIDSLGLLVVVGEVQNVGSSTVGSVVLAGTASSSDGSQVDSSINAYVVDLLPQQKAPFYWEFYDSGNENGGGWSHPDVSNVAISVYKADTTANYQYPDLKITNDHYSIGTNRGTGANDQTADYGVYWVNGQIQNTGSQTATNIRVIGTFYNASGAVVAVGGYINEVVNASLSPSASTLFKFGAFDINQTGIVTEKKITSYSLLIQVETPILQGAAPVITPYPSSGTITSTTSAPTPTAASSIGQGSQSDSASTQWIYVVAVVVALVAVAAALLLVRRRKGQSASESKASKRKK